MYLSQSLAETQLAHEEVTGNLLLGNYRPWLPTYSLCCRLSLDQAFEDNKDSSFGPPRSESPPATATSTSTPATPSTPAVPSSGSASGQSTPVAAKPAEDDWFAPRASPATPALSITVPAQPSPGLSQTSPRNSTPTLARSITSPALPQPASSQQSPQPATSPQQPPQRPTVAAQDAAEFMKNGMALLEKGSFSEALENVDNSIRVFCMYHVVPQHEIAKFCDFMTFRLS